MATSSSILAWKISWTKEPGDTVHGATKNQTQLNTYRWGRSKGYKHGQDPFSDWKFMCSCVLVKTLKNKVSKARFFTCLIPQTLYTLFSQDPTFSQTKNVAKWRLPSPSLYQGCFRISLDAISCWWSKVKSFTCVWLFATLWTVAH